ncbi:unnamed protein product [Brassica rapa subsp. trilocularis]
MRSRGDQVDVRSDAGSSKETTNSRHGSQRSGKSQDLVEPNSNPIEYTERERAELLRRLDSIKDHLLRGGVGGAVNENQQLLRPVHVRAPSHSPAPSYYHHHQRPYPYPPQPQGYHHHQDPFRRPPSFQGYPGGQYADVVDPHSYFPATPSRYGDMMPPYSPVSSHQRLYTTPVHTYNNSLSFPSSMSSPGPRGGGGYARWPSDLDSEMGGGGAFPRGYVKKAVSESDDARRCHPLAGGAPFIACRSCFELLYLPKKKILAQERLHKLQCGACSEVTSFSIVDKKLVFTTTEPVSVEDRSTTNTVVVEEPVQELKNQGDTTRSTRSESQHSDDEESSSVSSEQQQKEVKSVRRRVKSSKASEPAAAAPESASLLELFEHSNVNRAALAYGMAELGYIKPDKQEVFMKQDSVKPESIVATETEVSYNGYTNTTEISEDSNGREDKNRTRNPNEDGGKSIEVWVNGHLIPEDLVSSAEKLAGPIQAGKYWYDYRAGFWGVMGKPCLGIIPPFIEEFSHPMPDSCAAGNTEVYVNGRELHKRDLELLVGRGLPRDKNRSYILDITGRILDGDSGEELKSLGRLAPTIQKTKHGFGMRVPRSLAS